MVLGRCNGLHPWRAACRGGTRLMLCRCSPLLVVVLLLLRLVQLLLLLLLPLLLLLLLLLLLFTRSPKGKRRYS